mmetsp:Transcript_7247/g.11822  ORF Transcript_7247/g.11822 Transcript_7247/m.11822 type:complete len:208 (+) Transcript_7247:142-765(+)
MIDYRIFAKGRSALVCLRSHHLFLNRFQGLHSCRSPQTSATTETSGLYPTLSIMSMQLPQSTSSCFSHKRRCGTHLPKHGSNGIHEQTGVFRNLSGQLFHEPQHCLLSLWFCLVLHQRFQCYTYCAMSSYLNLYLGIMDCHTEKCPTCSPLHTCCVFMRKHTTNNRLNTTTLGNSLLMGRTACGHIAQNTTTCHLNGNLRYMQFHGS